MKGKEKIAANVGYSLIPSEQERVPIRCTISISIEEGAGEEEVEKGEKETDEVMAALALRRKAAVLTNDEELRTNLSHAGIVTAYLHGRNRLEESE